jgi:hypothetical protein
MIQHTVSGTILKLGDRRFQVQIPVEMAFDEENDPLAISMIFKVPDQEEVCWTMGRELVMRGATSSTPYGGGDVRFRSEPDLNRVLVCLRSAGGHADIGLDRNELIAFLNRTQSACKLGDEPLDDLIDQELKELLEG